jgi:hypothetical protein
MNAHREVLAHQFVASVLPETSAWPPEVALALYNLAFSALPDLVLELRGADARRWARGWRRRVDELRAMPAPVIAPEDAAWIAELARRTADAAPDTSPASGVEIARLAGLFERLGPLALALPWRIVRAAEA